MKITRLMRVCLTFCLWEAAKVSGVPVQWSKKGYRGKRLSLLSFLVTLAVASDERSMLMLVPEETDVDRSIMTMATDMLPEEAEGRDLVWTRNNHLRQMSSEEEEEEEAPDVPFHDLPYRRAKTLSLDLASMYQWMSLLAVIFGFGRLFPMAEGAWDRDPMLFRSDMDMNEFEASSMKYRGILPRIDEGNEDDESSVMNQGLGDMEFMTRQEEEKEDDDSSMSSQRLGDTEITGE